MDHSKLSVRQTLSDVKAFLAQESPPKLSEADTKAYFVEPLIKALGWEGLANVTREYYVRNSQEFIDYVLRGPTDRNSSGVITNLVAIETKAIQHELSDKHAAQLVQYCAVDGIEWAVLTNGRELQLFNTFLRPDLDSKRILRLDLLAFNSDEEYESVFQQLWQLSRENMTASKGVRTWMNLQRLDRLVREQLTTPGSAAIRMLEKALSDADIEGNRHQLVQWFRIHLGQRAIAPLERVGNVAVAFPEPAESSSGTTGVPKLNQLPLTFKSHVETGLLPFGTKLRLIRGGIVMAEAEPTQDGAILYQESAYRSLSDKTFANILGTQSLNGWTSWWADLPEGRVLLDTLRERLATKIADLAVSA